MPRQCRIANTNYFEYRLSSALLIDNAITRLMMVKETIKPYQINFDHRPEYLYVYLEGEELDYDLAKSYWKDIIEVQNQRRYSTVLVEKNFDKPLATSDVFRVLTEVAILVRLGVKFAFVERQFDAYRSEFEELVGNNRGMNIKFFDEIASAEKWLMVGKSGRQPFPSLD